jgi:hypothetical protein
MKSCQPLRGERKVYIHIFILNAINVLILKKVKVIKYDQEKYTSVSLQTTLAAEVYLVGQFLLEGKMLNIEMSMTYRAGTRRPKASKTE